MFKMIIKLLLMIFFLTHISHAEKCQKSNGMLRCSVMQDANVMLKGVTSCVVDRLTATYIDLTKYSELRRFEAIHSTTTCEKIYRNQDLLLILNGQVCPRDQELTISLWISMPTTTLTTLSTNLSSAITFNMPWIYATISATVCLILVIVICAMCWIVKACRRRKTPVFDCESVTEFNVAEITLENMKLD